MRKLRNNQNIPFLIFVFQIKIYIFILGFKKHIAAIRLLKTLDEKQRYNLRNLNGI